MTSMFTDTGLEAGWMAVVTKNTSRKAKSAEYLLYLLTQCTIKKDKER